MEDKEAFEIVLGLAQDVRATKPRRSPEVERIDQAILRVMEIADRLDQEDLGE
jgi:hypothetical protein